MWNSGNSFDTHLLYAVRMVKMGCATVEQAAASCGLEPAALQALLVAPALQTVEATEKQRFFGTLGR